MDEVRRNLASFGLGNLSPAQLASILGPEKMAALERSGRLYRLRDQPSYSATSQINQFENEESWVRARKQDINRAKEAVEVSLQTAPDESKKIFHT
jgi:hypothetical protein